MWDIVYMDDIPDVFRNSYQVLLKVFFFVNFFTHIALGFVAVLTILFRIGFTFYSEGLFRKVLALLILCCYMGLVANGLLSN